jgi:hypothetical protein
VKLKVAKLWNSDDTRPGSPDSVDETMYGMICSPSNRAEDALPKLSSESEPDIQSMRSDSTMLLAEWVFCRGTIISWEKSVPAAKLEPTKCFRFIAKLPRYFETLTNIAPGLAVPER